MTTMPAGYEVAHVGRKQLFCTRCGAVIMDVTTHDDWHAMTVGLDDE